MRILFLCYEFPPVGGGGGRALWQLCRHLPDLGVEADLVTSAGTGRHQEVPGEVRVYTVPTRRRSLHQAGPRAMLEYLWRARPIARRLLADRRYDLVHHFFSVPTGLSSFWLRHRVPYVVSLRGGDVPGYNEGEMQLLHALLKPFNRRVMRRAAAVTSVSDHLADAVRCIEPGLEVRVIPNGVEVELFRPPVAEADPRAPVHLLCVARLTEWKGLQYLLACLAGFEVDQSYRLTVVGTGSYLPALQRQAEALSLGKRVEFVGVVPHEELPRWYGSADVFVLPSYGDASPQTATEAMACGLPVVATRESGVRQYVEHGVGGFLVAARDAAALEQPLRALIEDPQLRRRMGKASADRVRAHFTWRAMAERFAGLYRELAGRAPSPASSPPPCSSSGPIGS